MLILNVRSPNIGYHDKVCGASSFPGGIVRTFSAQTFDNWLLDLGRAMLEERDNGIVFTQENADLLHADS